MTNRKVTFMIQTVKRQIVHDFAFELINHINFDERIGNDFNYITVDKPSSIDIENAINYIPVGSVEFVSEFLKYVHNIDYNPINIPKCLQQPEYLCRRYMDDFTGKELIFENPKDWFVKERYKLKGLTDRLDFIQDQIKPETHYIVSDMVDIVSEWRVFVHRGKILSVKNYSGDFWVMPDQSVIEDIISEYEGAPIAYTLDVAVIKNPTHYNNPLHQTVIIEIHDYFSCGLYGFDSDKHPYMLSQAFNEILRKNKS